jgi:hypothetical protein
MEIGLLLASYDIRGANFQASLLHAKKSALPMVTLAQQAPPAISATTITPMARELSFCVLP